MRIFNRIFSIASIALVMTVMTSSCSEGLLGKDDEPDIDKNIFECCGTVVGSKATGYIIYPDRHTSPIITRIYMAPGTDLEPVLRPVIDPLPFLGPGTPHRYNRVHMVYRCEPGGLSPLVGYTDYTRYYVYDAEFISAEPIIHNEIVHSPYFNSQKALPSNRLIDAWFEDGYITFITSTDPTDQGNENIYVRLHIDEERSTDDTLTFWAVYNPSDSNSPNSNQSYSSVCLESVADRYKDKGVVKVKIYGQNGLLTTFDVIGFDFLEKYHASPQ